MGNTSSIFYPDNENRLKRAQQLADDCKYCQDQYNASKARIEKALGPLKEKLDKLLKAFGCANIEELDKLVLKSATGDALKYWKEIRNNFDQSLLFDQVIMGAEAVVVMIGISLIISTGGVGIFADIGITTNVLLVLSLAAAMYDFLNGTIQRAKLRDAIDKCVPTRIKAKHAQEEMEQLEKSIPAIQKIYETYEELGYNKDKILEKFKDHDWAKSLKTETAAISYTAVGEDLADLDSSRKSWIREDPEWRPIADRLDAASPTSTNLMAVAMVNEGNVTRSPIIPTDMAETASVGMAELPPAPDADPLIKLSGDGIASILSGVLHIKLRNFESGHSAKVRLNSQDDKQTLMPDFSKHTVNWASSDASFDGWTLRFVNPADASKFATTHPNATKSHPDKVELYMHTGDTYVTKGGALSGDSKDPSVVLVASYA